MSKVYFNKKVNPAITKAKNLPVTSAQRVFLSSPIAESVQRLEKQNEEALNALSKLNGLVSQLAQSDQLNEISLNQQALLANYGAVQGQIMDEFKKLEEVQGKAAEKQEESRAQLDHLQEEVRSGATEVSELKETISVNQQDLLANYGAVQGQIMDEFKKLEEVQEKAAEKHEESRAQLDHLQGEVRSGANEVSELKATLKEEQLSERLQHLIKAIGELEKKETESVDTVLENNALQTLVLEEISRKQAEFGANQSEGLAALLKQLNLILTENERSHDTQLQNQKLVVDSLYKLVNQQYGLELYMD